ncbi:MAG: hypothetical protein GX047_08630 [Firmicutes bacterium]|nr:hypothetical protein [Bacillota bacterium]
MDSNLRRFLGVVLGTFLISLFSSYASNTLLGVVPVLPAMCLLVGIIAVGIVFDIIGVATTAALEVPYHAMAADKVPGSMEAMWVVRNAATIATLCNDMIGDIVGTLSGAVATGIALSITHGAGAVQQAAWVTFLVSGSAALMVGGKALGKDFAIQKANDIVYGVGKFLYVLETVFGLQITSFGNTVGSNRRRPAANKRKKTGSRTKQGV